MAAAINQELPGHTGVIRPVVRVPSWGLCGYGLEEFDVTQDYYHGKLDDGTDWRVDPAWSDVPTHTVQTPSGATLHVRPIVTGRTVSRYFGDRWVRGKLVVCHEDQASVSLPCSFLVD